MKCPKCGHSQSGGNECAECGIVFAKFLAMQKRRLERARQKEIPAETSVADNLEAVSQEAPKSIKGYFKVYVWDTFRAPWKPVPLYAVIPLLLFFPYFFYLLSQETFYHLYPDSNIVDSGLVSLFGKVTLVFHEGGHRIFGIFGNRSLTILGGSLNQVLIPFIVVVAFWQQRDASEIGRAHV